MAVSCLVHGRHTGCEHVRVLLPRRCCLQAPRWARLLQLPLPAPQRPRRLWPTLPLTWGRWQAVGGTAVPDKTQLAAAMPPALETCTVPRSRLPNAATHRLSPPLQHPAAHPPQGPRETRATAWSLRQRRPQPARLPPPRPPRPRCTMRRCGGRHAPPGWLCLLDPAAAAAAAAVAAVWGWVTWRVRHQHTWPDLGELHPDRCHWCLVPVSAVSAGQALPARQKRGVV